MASFLDNARGKSAEDSAPHADSDFAEFGNADILTPDAGDALGDTNTAQVAGKPFTKWYNVHERYTLQDFRAEGYILVIVAVIFAFHLFGSRRNRSKAKAWARAHAPVLRSEFSSVGFDGIASSSEPNDDVSRIIKEKSLFQFESYATGRANTAFVDVNLNLTKRFNPILGGVEYVLGTFFDTFPAPQDTLDAVIYPFDGREAKIVPSIPGSETKVAKSTYDGFVFAIVHKEKMQHVREDRYDVSLTSTKDSPKLPNWLAVMTENAEITETFLTPELIEAVQKAGDSLEYLIITDQPMDKPTTLDEIAKPKKRICLRYTLPSNNDYSDLLPLFSYFLRLPDLLVNKAHFRPEVANVLRKTRTRESAELERAKKQEEAEERRLELERVKKAKRDEQLKSMDAKSQKKFLEKEREKEFKKSQKKGNVRA
ncbi:uncharacterized protein DNG_01439 [Cephalotrichum gorgonifer]|uniref:DUF1682 domain-containing protein n=1 Tax=Cephalotrichum gorgonifer TaxID=2041049 RepID=A0AAE8MQJ2_9PEZI|nr:uncharacterized protein DNG_01439 [Cephalotrichum gorgonifer]